MSYTQVIRLLTELQEATRDRIFAQAGTISMQCPGRHGTSCLKEVLLLVRKDGTPPTVLEAEEYFGSDDNEEAS